MRKKIEKVIPEKIEKDYEVYCDACGMQMSKYSNHFASELRIDGLDTDEMCDVSRNFYYYPNKGIDICEKCYSYSDYNEAQKRLLNKVLDAFEEECKVIEQEMLNLVKEENNEKSRI